MHSYMLSLSLSGGAIAAIVLGIIAAIGIVVTILFFRRRNTNVSERRSFFVRPRFLNLAQILPSMNSPSSISSSFASHPLSPNAQSDPSHFAISHSHSVHNYPSHQPTGTLSNSQPIHVSVQKQAPCPGPVHALNPSSPHSGWFDSPTGTSEAVSVVPAASGS